MISNRRENYVTVGKKNLIYVIGITFFVKESNIAWGETCIYPWEYQKCRPLSDSTAQ